MKKKDFLEKEITCNPNPNIFILIRCQIPVAKCPMLSVYCHMAIYIKSQCTLPAILPSAAANEGNL